MFDLKKRSSLNLSGSREAEEFRRVAIRRKSNAVLVGECRSTDVISGVCGSYTGGSTAQGEGCDSEVQVTEDEKKSPPRSLLKPQAYPRDQAKSAAAAARSPHVSTRDLNVSPSRDPGVLLSPAQNCSTSPTLVTGGGGRLLIAAAAAAARISPSNRQVPKVTSSPLLRTPSPGKRGFQSSSLKGVGHSPAKLSPRNKSSFMGKLRTPSPIQKTGSHVSPKSPKGILGLHRVASGKTDKREKKGEKGMHTGGQDVDRVSGKKVERPPLKMLQSANCNGPGITVEPPADSSPSTTAKDIYLASDEADPSPQQQNGEVMSGEQDVNVVNGDAEKRTPVRCGSRFSCEWTRTTTEATNPEPKVEENVEEPMMTEAESESKEEETEKKLFNIANELLQTERTYVARLHLLDKVFCSRLTEEADRGSFPPEVIRNIFSNISNIHSFHSQFLLPDLERCISRWEDSPGLGTPLLHHAPFLKMYADYMKNFASAMQLLRTWTERSSTFRNIIQDIQSQEVCGNLTLQHHMLEPVQRVPRYEMLLKDYLKNLTEDNPDFDLSQKALQAISLAATHSDSAVQKSESFKRQLEILEMVGEDEMIDPTTEFLKEGRLLKIASRNTLAMERHLFLFNNFLLCCHPRFSLAGQRFSVRNRIGVDGMQVQRTANEEYPYTFQVSGKERTLELQAGSEQDRGEWIKVIQEAIDKFQERNETFRAASKDPVPEKPTRELGKRAPRWIRDNEVTQCMTCQEAFNPVTRRRHHCRACGYVVCWKCSEYKVALEYDGHKVNKVCKVCYPVLMLQRAQKGEKKRSLPELSQLHRTSEALQSGFLRYDDSSVWCVLSSGVPPCLHVYAALQDVKPVFSVLLLDCTIRPSGPQELQARHCFSISRSSSSSSSSHVFCCDSPETQQSWVAALKESCGGMDPAATVIAHASANPSES